MELAPGPCRVPGGGLHEGGLARRDLALLLGDGDHGEADAVLHGRAGLRDVGGAQAQKSKGGSS